MTDYLTKFTLIIGVFNYSNQWEMKKIAKFMWEELKQFNIYEHGKILTDNKQEDLTCTSYYDASKLEVLKMSKSGDCIKLLYEHPYYSCSLSLYINKDNKLQALKCYDANDRIILDLFYGEKTVKFYNITIPLDELDEVLFQLSTVYQPDLSFLKDFSL